MLNRLLRLLLVFPLVAAAACNSTSDAPPTAPADDATGSTPTTTAATVAPATAATVPPPATIAAPPAIEIRGDDEFVIWTEMALTLLESETPDSYAQVLDSIRFIESVSAGSGMDVFNKIYLVGDETAHAPGFDQEAQLTWYAATIVHDSCHSVRYDRGVSYMGKEAEVACLMDQLVALGRLSNGLTFTAYIQGLIDGADDPENQYWNDPNRHW